MFWLGGWQVTESEWCPGIWRVRTLFLNIMKIGAAVKVKSILSALAVVGLAVASQSALAGTITATYASSANFGSGGVGYYNGSVAPNPNSTTSLVGVGIGGDSFTSTNHTYDFSATGQFNTWCVDIYHWMSGGAVTYTVGTGSDLAGELNTLRPGTPTGATRVAELGQLANEVYSTLGAGTLAQQETKSAAFQLAVWAITYGAPTNAAIDTTNSGFRVDSGTASSAYGVLANTWLANLGTAAPTANYKLTYLTDGTAENTQDMVVFTNVPEPATLGLLAIGLLGLEFGRRKLA